ncbi:helix-turn-helix domain-containing protein [Shewanella khirikhana]|uniref:Antitoxin HigA n=1 Tax=Shewanella khirikhana TaxID=1965282 RepID=A0ABM7DXE7_9GAMM|nr:DNA-binding protein [Shewanella khirikhana]AZQ13281.1 Antitoxin HigA [Shewanella khirikhana]
MQINPIRTVADNKAALKRIEQLFDAEPNTPDGDELEILITLVTAFEDAQFSIEAPDPIAAIRFRMEQQGLVDADMVPFLGQRSRVSEVLNRQRRLSLSMIRKLNEGLKIPLECLIKDYQLVKTAATK